MTSQELDKIMKDLLVALRAADRKAFESFVDAFELYSIDVMSNMVKAPQDCVLNMQGRAHQCQAILLMMRNCHVQKSPMPPQAI